jgi:single-stranded-DNA-specific exonuclease
VIGIVASRLIETYHKPTIVFTKSGDRYAASARSVPGFDLYKAIENCKQYLIQYGGHPCAAGFTLYPENYQKFKDAFEEEVKNTIQQNMLEPEILVDAEITFDQITPKFLRILNQFAPFGPSNMQPIFLTRNLYDTGYAKCIGADAEHLSLYIKNNTSTKIPAVGFNLKSRLSLVSNHQPFMAVYTIDENEYQGKTNIQLRLKDIKSN